MRDETVRRLHALADPDPCEVCNGRQAVLLTQLVGLPVLGVVQCPACTADQPAHIIRDHEGAA